MDRNYALVIVDSTRSIGSVHIGFDREVLYIYCTPYIYILFHCRSRSSTKLAPSRRVSTKVAPALPITTWVLCSLIDASGARHVGSGFRAGVPTAQTRQGAPALIRTMQNPKMRARGENRPADGDYGAPTARRHCSGARGAIPMGSTGPTRCARRALLPRAVWR